MKPHRVMLIALLFLVLPFAAFAQADDSQVVLFHGTRGADFSTLGGELLVLSLADASIQTIPLPPQLFPVGNVISGLSLSPDHRYLAVASQNTTNESAPPILILDLQSDSCCVTVHLPWRDVAMYELGDFSPDSGRLALAWFGFIDRTTYDSTAGIMTVDAATGIILQAISMADVRSALGLGYTPTFATIGAWREDGIRWIENCYACEPDFEGEWMIWTPETNSFTVNSGEYFSFVFGDVLPATSEMLYTGQSAQFPVSQEPAYLPIPNVVYYIHDAPIPTFTEPTTAPVIYFDENQLDISGGGHWVLDGQAVLVSPYMSSQWTLLYRDGTRQSVTVPVNSTFLLGTPNGWLTLNDDPNGAALTMYTVEGAEVLATPLGMTLPENEYVEVLDAPELGGSVTDLGAFATVEPRFPPVSETGTCPGLLPTRLTVHTLARVTPGVPNRLRANPSLDGAILTEIPGGAEIYLLQGPTCDTANGIIWWQVGYNNLIGWTAEGQGDTYFVEPFGVG